MRHLWTIAVAASVAAGASQAYGAKNVLTPSDAIISIDRDEINLTSIYPANEGPNKAIDNLYLPTSPQTSTKYLNFGRFNTGFIIDPNFGSSTVQSIRINTANDSEARDPATYQLYGSNDPAILSGDNSTGGAESWTLISEGALSLPAARRATGPVVPIANSTSYNLYRLIFPTLKTPNAATAMQIGDVEFYETADGSTPDIFDSEGLDPMRAVKLPTPLMSESIAPANQEANAVIDGNVATKYLNFGINNTGFIVTPSRGPEAVNAFQITTANDSEGRDPTKYEIYGTNMPIASTPHSTGTGETWTLIDAGDLSLPADRNTAANVVSFTNATEYASYKILFPEIKGPAATTVPPAQGTITSMQIANIQFYADGSDAPGDFNGDGSVDADDLNLWKTQFGFAGVGINADGDNSGKVDGNDFLIWQRNYVGAPATVAGGAVPEPGSVALAVMGAVGLAGAFRRCR